MLIIGHHLASDLSALVRNGYQIPNAQFFCTDTAAKWCWPDLIDGRLEHLALRLTEMPQWRPYEKWDEKTFDAIPDDNLSRRCGGDAEAAFRLYRRVFHEITELRLERIFGLAMDVLPILGEIGGTGMAVDTTALAHRAAGQHDDGSPIEGSFAWLEHERTRLQAILGIENLDSHQQVASALFGEKFSATPLKKTTQGWSSDRTSLLWARYQANQQKNTTLSDTLSSLLNYALREKLYSTYYKPWLTVGKGVRVHSVYSLGATSTGRLCVAKGTMIEVVRDISKFPQGIPIENVRPGDLVHTFDKEGRLTVKRVLWSGCTGKKKAIRVHWETGTGPSKRRGYVDLTPEHKVRLVSGEYKQAKDLALVGGRLNKKSQYLGMVLGKDGKKKGKYRYVSGDRLVGVYRYITAWGYSRLRFTGGFSDGEFDHKIIMGVPFGRTDVHVHHKNGNKLDNRKENLEVLDAREHVSLYGSSSQKIQKDAKNKQSALRKALREHLKVTNFPYAVGYCHYQPPQIDKEFPPYNHRVYRKEELPNEVEVYDLEIEDTNNFIANEICVHNSSHNLNLQNLPKIVRELVVPSDGYDVLIQADAKQIELGGAAHLSQDPTLLRWVREGKDIHAIQAARVLGLPEPQSGDDVARFKDEYALERFVGKRVNFSSLYGVSADSLSWQIFEDTEGQSWIPPEEVQRYIDAFFSTFTGWTHHKDRLWAQLLRKEWVVGPTGRRWIFPATQAGWRQAQNYPVQSLCSDLILMGLLQFVRELRRRRLKSRVIGEVHDSILLESPAREVVEVCDLIGACFEHPNTRPFGFTLSVPIRMELQKGPSWGNLQPI